MIEHELKTLDVYFDAVANGTKKFEVRLNDRGFQKGDLLILRHMDATGFVSSVEPPLFCNVLYVLQGGQFGIDPRYCVMSIEPRDGASK